jgi:hypothetical protein
MIPALLTRMSRLEPLESVLDCLVCVHRLGDVGLYRLGPAAQARDVVGKLIQAVAAAGDECHLRALLGQEACGRGTDAAAGAGDERDGAGQRFVGHGCPSSSCRGRRGTERRRRSFARRPWAPRSAGAGY